MINRILVGFDGSELGRAAFDHALILARAGRMSIHAFHLIEPPPPTPIVGDAVAGFDPNPILVGEARAERREEQEERDWARRSLETLAEEAARHAIPYSFEVGSGRLVHWLVDRATSQDLICVGRKGRFSRAGIGSSTKDLVRHASCPVLVASAKPGELRRILCVDDGAECAAHAVEAARTLAKQTGWPLRALATKGRHASAEQAAARLAQNAPEAEVVEDSDANASEVHRIEAFLKAAPDGLLVLGAYSENWINQLLFGSTAAELLARAETPVILVR
ncbi:MAG: universal stress protein [Planctomycetota bacterium]|nr:universal stress protein [Planctomycetota bacterium]